MGHISATIKMIIHVAKLTTSFDNIQNSGTKYIVLIVEESLRLFSVNFALVFLLITAEFTFLQTQ